MTLLRSIASSPHQSSPQTSSSSPLLPPPPHHSSPSLPNKQHLTSSLQSVPPSPSSPTSSTVAHSPPLLINAPLPSPPPPLTLPISLADRHTLQRVFHIFDENHDGKISKQELATIFDKLGIVQTEQAVSSLLDSAQLKVVGQMDEDEFIYLYETTCSIIQQLDKEDSGAETEGDRDHLEAFYVFDKDKNGFITPGELQSVLCDLGFPQARQLDACVQMIKRVDVNGDGQIDFFEFKKMLGLQDLFRAISC